MNGAKTKIMVFSRGVLSFIMMDSHLKWFLN